MSTIARMVGTLLAVCTVWPLIGPLVPPGFWLLIALLPLLRRFRDEPAESPAPEWVNDVEAFANEKQ